MMKPEENLEKINLELPPTPTPHGVYKPFVIAGNYIYVVGHGPYLADGGLMRALARGGNRRAAIEQYERCRDLLKKELGIEP